MPSLPAFIKFNIGMNEEFEDTVVRFEPDQGPDLTYRRSSGIARQWVFDTVLSDTDTNTLLDFFEDEAEAGSALFDMNHPRRAITVQAKFLGTIRVTAESGRTSRVRFTLLTQPATVGEL